MGGRRSLLHKLSLTFFAFTALLWGNVAVEV